MRQHHLADVLGVSAASVSRLVHGRGIDPASKQGELALLYCVVFFYFAFRGSGRYGADAALRRRG